MPQHARPENHSPWRISLKYIEEKHNGRSESIMGCLCGELHSLQGQGPEYPKHSSKPAAAQKGFVMKNHPHFPLACSLLIQGAGPIAMKEARAECKQPAG